MKYGDVFSTFKAGDVIFKEGETGHLMYVVKAGTIELRVMGRPVESLETNDILGEMALVDNQVRSATAVATTDCQVVPVDVEKFQYMIKETPYFAIEVLQIMARRLRAMNRQTSIMLPRQI